MTEAEKDDAAVDAFAARMKKKLAKKRAEGRHGWRTCAPIDLAQMFIEHIGKGDPVDLANFAMFLGSIDVYKGSVRAALRMALVEWVTEHAQCRVLFS
jgi:hypothetical protein